MTFAADDLVGKELNGWNVVEKLPEPDRSKGQTGGNFSVCYYVEKEDRRCFLKVLNYNILLGTPPPGITRTEILQRSR